MSTNIYLDLVENPVKRWISSFCDVMEDDFDFIGEEYCLIFPETIKGEKKCVMLYADLVYPPFDDEIDFSIKDNNFLDGLIMGMISHIRKFYAVAAKTIIENKIKGSDLLKNTILGFYKPNYTFAPYIIEEKFVKENLHLYSSLLGKETQNEEENEKEEKARSSNARKELPCGEKREKEEAKKYIKICRRIINDYTKNKIRIGINVKVLDDVPAPSYIVKVLLCNYLESLSSDSSSLLSSENES